MHPPGPRRGISLLERSAASFIALIPLAVKIVCYPRYPGSDDAFIHLAIARNLIAGQGWGIQAGDPVNMSSSPLYTLILWGMGLLGVQGVLPAQILSLAFCTGAVLLLHHIMRFLSDSQAVRLAATALGALQIHLWRWNGVAMETTMACFALGAVLLAHYGMEARGVQRTASWCVLGLFAGLATLARFELGLLLPALVLSLLYRRGASRPRVIGALAGGFLLVVGGWAIFAQLYFGSILPTTFYAKTSSLRFWNPTVAGQVVSVMASGAGLPLLASFVAALFVLLKEGRKGASRPLARACAPLTFATMLLAFYYLKTEGLQSAGRYCLPALYIVPMLFAAAMAGVTRLRPGRYLGFALAACVVAQAGFTLHMNQRRATPVLAGFESNYWNVMREAASELQRVCRDGDTVLIEEDIGVISFERAGRCRIADGGALASPELKGLSLERKVEASGATFVLESLGRSPGDLQQRETILELLRSWQFRSHSVGDPDRIFFCNLYRVGPAGV